MFQIIAIQNIFAEQSTIPDSATKVSLLLYKWSEQNGIIMVEEWYDRGGKYSVHIF